MEDHNKTLGEFKFCYETNEYGVYYSFRSNKHEISMVKQKKLALNTFDGKRCYIDKSNSVPWGYNPLCEIKDAKHPFEPFRTNK